MGILRYILRRISFLVLCILCILSFLIVCQLTTKLRRIKMAKHDEVMLLPSSSDFEKPSGLAQISPSNQSNTFKSDASRRPAIKTFVTNKEVCTDTKVDVLIYIQSHWENAVKRRSLRNTWASRRTFNDIVVRTVFVLGLPSDMDDQVRINNENLVHGDIIQGAFQDSFQNLTLKSILMLDWIAYFCPNAKYIIKSDDDMFVNVLSVVENVLPKLKRTGNAIACAVKPDGSSPIVRNKNSKWYIPDDVFKNRTHLPKFCTGYTLMMTSDLARKLHTASVTSDVYISVDDVYIFGLLLNSIPGVHYIDMTSNFTLSYPKAEQEYSSSNTQTFVAVGVGNNRDMAYLWSLVLLKMSDWVKQHIAVTLVP